MRIMRQILALALACLPLASALEAAAQEYPTKPIKIVVPYTPGGTTDNLARLCAQGLAEAWGQQVIVDNRPGASGSIGAKVVADAAPDGYTLLLATSTQLATNVALYPNLSYQPLRDFAPVGLLVKGYNVLVVHPSVPAKSVNELIALAKARPGQLNFATSGNGTSQHLSAELFKTMAGVNMVHIPYKGSAPALVDLLSGQVPVMFENILTVVPHIKAGTLRALAVTGAKRWPTLSELPTIAEAGLPGYEISGFYGIVAPAGTPRPIVAKLNKELSRIISDPNLRERLLNQGFEPSPSTSDEFTELIKAYIVKNAQIVKEAAIKVD
ncbi:MAG TPA: tripartite tricarboxylate transporter substrate binding protein [Burkholderiaceae bacterium]|nr:tripartite tricarboxylate transporter substrate binding protein [Burkholderiaceae bacterium]